MYSFKSFTEGAFAFILDNAEDTADFIDTCRHWGLPCEATGGYPSVQEAAMRFFARGQVIYARGTANSPGVHFYTMRRADSDATLYRRDQRKGEFYWR